MKFVKIKVKSFFSLFFRAGRYVAVLEYAHLSIKLDLKKAIGEVKEACENIQRTMEHVRRDGKRGRKSCEKCWETID